jgi:drug/metabolite transporter (DMT)-like permease
MNVELTQLPNILIMSIIGTGMSTLFFLMGLKLIGEMRTILLYSTTSVFGILFSWMFLSEVVTPTNIFSSMLVFAGIFLLRNKLAGTETSEETEIIEREIIQTNTSHVILAKELSNLAISDSKAKEKIKNILFPNCGIG